MRLLIKNTDERATFLPEIVKQLRAQGLDIDYILDRTTNIELRELMAKCHVLAYNPIHTSAGLPILEAAAMELPTIVGDYSPTNIYPSVEKIKCMQVPIAQVKEGLCRGWGLPYTFAGLGVDEKNSLMNWMDVDDYANKLLTIKNNYDNIYINKGKECRQQVLNGWTWAHSCRQLLNNLNA
jgi:glycosyltransferase involved in cell wall biosynthesis